MSGKSSRTAWLTSLFALTTATGLLSATPAGAVTGSDVKDGGSAFTVKLNVGDKQACSGALVDAQWVLTAASCFSDGGQPAQTGKPSLKTTVTVGRTDLSQSAGSVVEAVNVIPRADRDVALVKLAWPVVGITPVKVSVTAPAAGELLQSTGFGRTKTEWVPNRMHSGAFTVATVDGGSVNLNGSDNAVICQGDAGAPAVRDNNGAAELVAVNSRSWQGGCLGTDPAETRTSATDARVDDLGSWVAPYIAATNAARPSLSSLIPNATTVMSAGDFNQDGRSDLAVVLKDGSLHTFAGRDGGTFEYGRPLWKNDGSWKAATKIIAGDFNGDGFTDIAAVGSDGRLRLYAGKSDGTLADGKLMWADTTTNWNGMLQLARFKSDATGRDGLLAVWGAGPAGALYAYPTNGEGVLSGDSKSMWKNDGSWKAAAKLTTGDFNGDGRDDVAVASSDGALIRFSGNPQGGLSDGVSMWRDKTWGAAQLILAGDFDGDGKVDLGSLWGNQQRFNFFKGDGAGALADGQDAWPRG
ncbi:FG-GAP-like repeat-containing protein [Streptomyces sp. NPDC059928]|uniref:FG-GAP-like repeat-containing protein n=1 Tax=unclassified Streptomyces TaxID=2593676 RepID=UPI00365D5FFE